MRSNLLNPTPASRSARCYCIPRTPGAPHLGAPHPRAPHTQNTPPHPHTTPRTMQPITLSCGPFVAFCRTPPRKYRRPLVLGLKTCSVGYTLSLSPPFFSHSSFPRSRRHRTAQPQRRGGHTAPHIGAFQTRHRLLDVGPPTGRARPWRARYVRPAPSRHLLQSHLFPGRRGRFDRSPSERGRV